MPDETVPSAATPDSTESRASPCVLGALGCGGAALVGVLVLVVTLAWGSWGSTDFPRVAPGEMANRALQRSQEAYGVLGFKRTIEPGVEDIGVSTENTYGSSFCYDGGLLGLEDETVDGAYSMSHTWALDHVPASQAVPGLRRLHRFLKDNGWEITSYREGGQGRNGDLYVQRDDGDERMSFTWYSDREYFTGGASVPCAYDPEWGNGDVGPAGDDQRPPAFGPARRH
ncbi:class I SAM-dependent methyltransferase [Streptomyces sp. NPDC002992]|uniref:class I SAM-dependent methyltransferase n=1 Tax=Streptomyces sp. NPDC002992 TaxID=3154273 RepID=UPI0033BF8926